VRQAGPTGQGGRITVEVGQGAAHGANGDLGDTLALGDPRLVAGLHEAGRGVAAAELCNGVHPARVVVARLGVEKVTEVVDFVDDHRPAVGLRAVLRHLLPRVRGNAAYHRRGRFMLEDFCLATGKLGFAEVALRVQLRQP
jgi:hypothetical protein